MIKLDMVTPQDNKLIAMLPSHDLAVLSGHFNTIELRPGDTLAQPGDDIHIIYFPHSGIISFMVEMADGHVVQTSMVGRDGVIGSAQALDDKVSLNKIIVQMPGLASVIDREHIRAAVRGDNSIRKALAAYEQFFVADIQQTAGCNALHNIEQRICRWLLRMADLAGPDIHLTHDQLAAMIGATRSSITHTAGGLQSRGIITYHRGAIRVTDAGQLEQTACECHKAVRHNYKRMFGAL